MGNAQASCGRFGRRRPASPAARAGPARGQFEEGDAVGRYEVCEKLGQGMGGGVVYRVRPRQAAAKGESPVSGDSTAPRAALMGARHACEDSPHDGGTSPEAEEACDYDGEEFVALKYPVNREEEEFCQALHGQLCLGVPRIFDLGWHSEECYVVVQLLGAPVSRLFELLAPQDIGVRWQVLRVLGRQMVRRLRAVHRLGFVHCDVNPSNILLGGDETWTLPEAKEAAPGPEPRGRDDGEAEAPREAALGCRPFLIDFGCARRYPDGEPMLPYWGSVDYTSINALASECCRGPYDDLESLGWLLLHGLFCNKLPWTQWVQAAWSVNGMGESSMMLACQQVRLAKVALLELGHTAFEPCWAHLAELPADLRLYLRRCRSEAAYAAADLARSVRGDEGAGLRAPAADHEALLQILGGPGRPDDHDAELQDVGLLRGFEFGPPSSDAGETADSEDRHAGCFTCLDSAGASSPVAPVQARNARLAVGARAAA